MFSDANKRKIWIPILMGLVWIGSFLVGFFDLKDLSGAMQFIFRLTIALNLMLFFEILLMFWDMKLALRGFELHRDHAFIAQYRTTPFGVLGLSFSCMTLAYPEYWWIYITDLVVFKVSVHHAVAYVDQNKKDLSYSYSQPESV